MLTRRAFLLTALAVAGTACGPSDSAGVRGFGTVLRAQSPLQSDIVGPSNTPTPTAAPPATTPTLAPIVPPEAVPTLGAPGGTDAQSRIIPLPQNGRPPAIPPLPPKRVLIPSIGVDTRIVELGTTVNRRGELVWETAAFAVGHHRGTAGPGQPGNMVLSGHISSPNEGAIFHRLPDVKVGDGVVVMSDERQYLYRVSRVQVVTPHEVRVMDPTAEATATLLTCVPDGIYSHRLVVSTRLA